MGLEVIGAGFGRTGTLSMKAALEHLGYRKTHHMEEVMRSRRQIDLWHEVGRGGTQRWDEIFDGYRACVDFPSAKYYAEILAAFPEAKVVLTVRDVDRWYASTAATIYRVTEVMPRWRVVPRFRRAAEMVDATVWDGLFDGRFADEAHAKRVFTDHVAEVRSHVPPDQLLVFEVAQGWEPLCAFLGCAVPDEPFPHLNDAASFQFNIRALRFVSALPAIGAAGAALAIVLRRIGSAR